MVDFKLASVAGRVVKAVLDDLGGRKGFGHWWDQIDDGIREEIERELRGVVYRVLRTGDPQ